MIKKTILAICAIIFLNFCSNNVSYAIEDLSSPHKYPDYGYEFTGKDTFEKFNRKLFIFNMKLNKYVLRPVNTVWASVMPQYGMDRIKNAYNNVNYPVRLVSCTLQRDFKALGQETKRFFINTTLGVGGLYDPAKDRFKMEPRQEDMQQALAHYKKIKQGPYLVLPVLHGNTRDVVGQVLNYPLNPCSYVLGPLSIAVSAAFYINNSAYIQPLIKKVETTYADPYEIIRQADGVEKYIKNVNLDRSEVFAEKTAVQNIIKINNILNNVNSELKSDIQLSEYNPQSPLIDAMRTSLFDNYYNFNNSIWSDISVWNRGFDKKIKTASVKIYQTQPKYKYRYVLQKNPTAPVAIIFPSIGEGILADKSVVQAKILYDAGYSVIIEGSSVQWEFVKSMPDDYRPGLPERDALYVRVVTSKILDDIQSKKGYNFSKKIVVGTSFGALTSLFVAAQEANDNTLNISHYISINPPIETFFALNQVDKYSKDWQNDSSDIKTRAAITVEKVLQKVENVSNKHIKNKSTYFPFTDDEAKLILSFVMKQKLSDLIFTIENCSKSKKCKLYETINEMSFNDYAQKYLFVNEDKTMAQLDYESSLYSIADFLKNNKNYKIYHSIDDYYVTPQQLIWLKKQSGSKTVFFSNGSHLGCLYRPEFINEFKNEINLTDTIEQKELPQKEL